MLNIVAVWFWLSLSRALVLVQVNSFSKINDWRINSSDSFHFLFDSEEEILNNVLVITKIDQLQGKNYYLILQAVYTDNKWLKENLKTCKR